MDIRRSRRLSAVLMVSIISGVTAACGGDSDGAGADTLATTTTESTSAPTTNVSTTVAAPATTSMPTTSTTTSTTVVPGVVVEIEVAAGGVVGGAQRVQVPLGEQVTIAVIADVADEVHVHGYDLYGDVTPTDPVQITFVADIPGVFEVELEDVGLELVRLEVS